MKYDETKLTSLPYEYVRQMKQNAIVLVRNPFVDKNRFFVLSITPDSNIITSKLYRKFDYFKVPREMPTEQNMPTGKK